MRGKRLRELGRIYERIASLVLNKILIQILGGIEKRVFVGGSFKTWPLMDFVSRILARLGYTVLTAGYTYMTDSNGKVIRQKNAPEQDESMNTYLKRLINSLRGLFSCLLFRLGITTRPNGVTG